MNIKKRMVAFIMSSVFLSTLAAGGCTTEKKFSSVDGESQSASSPGAAEGERRPLTQEDFLKADGQVLRNRAGEGEIVDLRGTNLGGWLHREGWMDGGGTDTIRLDASPWRLSECHPALDGETALKWLTDNDLSTVWNSQGIADARLTLDLSARQKFNRVTLLAGNSGANEALISLKLSVSDDGTTWQTVQASVQEEDGVTLSFGDTWGRYIRLEQQEDGPVEWHVAELKVSLHTHVNDYLSRTIIEERFGAQKAEELLTVYQKSYITGQDLDYIASLGFNFVRLPIYWMELMDNEGKIKENAFEEIDWAVKECGQRGLYVMLDLHGSPGGHSAGWLTGGQLDSNELWTNPTYREWTIRIWETMAARYKGNPAVAGYDLLNEPVLPESGAQVSIAGFYNTLYQKIRAVDPDHLIVMGAFYNFDTLGSPKRRGWVNVMYQTHHYDEGNKLSEQGQINFAKGQLAYIQSYKEKWDVPVLAGEFNFWQFESAWKTWLEGLNQQHVSWSNWAYKNTDTDTSNNWALYYVNTTTDIRYQSDSFDTIAKRWGRYATAYYQKNTVLETLLSRYAQGE